MANPFLILGGVAVGIITAGIGVLQVPGWVAATQDSAAKNDVAQVTIAQAAATTHVGRTFGSIAELNASGSGVQVTPSNGVCLILEATGSNALTIARSASGTVFARVNSGAIGEGTTLAAAVADAGGIPELSGLAVPAENAACDDGSTSSTEAPSESRTIDIAAFQGQPWLAELNAATQALEAEMTAAVNDELGVIWGIERGYEYAFGAPSVTITHDPIEVAPTLRDAEGIVQLDLVAGTATLGPTDRPVTAAQGIAEQLLRDEADRAVEAAVQTLESASVTATGLVDVRSAVGVTTVRWTVESTLASMAASDVGLEIVDGASIDLDDLDAAITLRGLVANTRLHTSGGFVDVHINLAETLRAPIATALVGEAWT